MSALPVIAHILSHMARGNGVALIPMREELTTTEAAKALKVSRTFMINLLEKGKIPFRKVGTHRRVRFRDLMAYQSRKDDDRLESLEAVSALEPEYGLRQPA